MSTLKGPTSASGSGQSAQVRAIRVQLEKLYEPASLNRLRAMDGVRGLAVSLVFFVHFDALFRVYVTTESMSAAISNVLGIVGNTGVDIFFILSGYLIYGTVVRRPLHYWSFIRRRAQRIYPAFLTVFAVYLSLSFILPEQSKIPAQPFTAVVYVAQNIALLPGLFEIRPIISVAWSLSYEVFYYLSIPLFVALLRLRTWPSRGRVGMFLFLLLASTAVSLTGLHAHFRLVMFIAGILLYETHKGFQHYREVSLPSELLATFAFGAALALFYMLTDGQWARWALTTGQAKTAKILLLFATSYWLLVYTFGRVGFLRCVFEWTPLRWLGSMSYSYYLIHGLTLQCLAFVWARVFLPTGNQPLVFWFTIPIALAATWTTSTILFLLVEKPFSLAPAVRANLAGVGSKGSVVRKGASAREIACE